MAVGRVMFLLLAPEVSSGYSVKGHPGAIQKGGSKKAQRFMWKVKDEGFEAGVDLPLGEALPPEPFTQSRRPTAVPPSSEVWEARPLEPSKDSGNHEAFRG